MSSEEEIEAQELAKAFFQELDTPLRLLLATIERYRQLVHGEETAIKEQDGHQTPDEKFIGLLKSQVQLLDVCIQNLEAFYSPLNETSTTSSTARGKALGILFPYFILPLQVILGNYHVRVEHSARQSLQWQCLERAAKLLSFVVQHSILIGSDMLLQLLIKVTNCLALGTNDNESPQSDQLDRGEDYIRALLTCLQVLINASSQDLLLNGLEGHLIAPIAMSCVSILSPPIQQMKRQDVNLVLEALATLKCLMNKLPLQSTWRPLFPGCCQSILQRTLHESRQGSSNIAAQGVYRMSQLISITLKQERNSAETTPPTITEQLRKLQLQASGGFKDGPASSTDAFVSECNNRLTTPLTLLFRVLPTSRSHVVLEATIELCRTILMDTWSVWKDTEHTVEMAALQCCLILINDKDNSVQENARNVLESFQSTQRWEPLESFLVSNVLEIIRELPTFAHSHCQVELQTRLKLSRGYLDLCGASTALTVALRNPEEASMIRSSLSTLFDMDFSSLQATSKVVELSASVIPYLLLTKETIPLAQDMVESVGNALGMKHSMAFVDASIADLHESYTHHLKDHSPVSFSQVSFVHEWIGTVEVANLLLQSRSEATVDLYKTIRRYKSFASNIVPLMTSSPLWTLPTLYQPISGIEYSGGTNDIDSGAPPNLNASAQALRGNAALLVSILNLIKAMVTILGAETRSLLPTLLYPLFEKASQHNHSQVRSAAIGAIRSTSEACSFNGIEMLISENLDYLFESIITEVHQSGTFVTAAFHAGIAKTVIESALREPLGKVSLCRSKSVREKVDMVVKVGSELALSFDRSIRLVGSTDESEPALVNLGFFDASIQFMLHSFGLSNDDLKNHVKESEGNNEPWLDLLHPFRTMDSRLQSSEACRTNEKSEDQRAEKIHISWDELNYLRIVLSRCGFLIAHPALVVSAASCRVQSLAFYFLSYIGRHHVESDDEPSGENPGNAIYRQVSDSWPSIRGRIWAISKEFCEIRNTRRLPLQNAVQRSPSTDNSSPSILLLATLMDLVGDMSWVGGSFMYGRLEEDVWPECINILKVILLEEHNRRAVMKHVDTTDKDKLLISILKLFQKIFSQSELGVQASSMISSTGSVILPFVNDPGVVGNYAMEAVRSMLKVDCDALWRPLLSSCNETLPGKPLQYQKNVSMSSDVVPVKRSLLQSRAEELMDFGKRLPEQGLRIDYL